MEIFNHIPMDWISQCSYFILLLFCFSAAHQDIKTRTIPNWIPVGIGIFWVLASCARVFLVSSNYFNSAIKEEILVNVSPNEVLPYILQGLIAAVSVLGLLLACIYIVNSLRKLLKKKKQSVLGAGDIKLLTVISLYFGYVGSFICIFVACFLFILYFILIALFDRYKKNGYAFAPFIFIGVLAAVGLAYVVLFYA